MPTIRTRSPLVSRQKQLLQIQDLTGGVDLRRSQTLLESNRGRTYKNWSLEEPGALVVRKGYRSASTATYGANPQGGRRVYLASTAFTLIAMDGSVYKPTDAWVQGSAVYSTVSTSAQVYFPYDRDLVAVLDATSRPRFSTNGSTWLLMGTNAPTVGAALSTNSTGGLSSGEFSIIYTYKHRGTGHESNASTASTITIQATSGSITTTATGSTDPKVDAYVWYAKHVSPDGEGIYRKVSSGSSATIIITSSAWTTNDEVPTNHDVPPALTYAAIWKSRWWAKDAATGNRLRFTELFQPQTWPTLFYIDIPFEKGDSITSIHPLGDTLIVYGQSGAFLVIGQTALDFEVRPSQIDTGALGFRAVAKVEQASLHISGDGVASYDGATDRDLEHDIAIAWRDLIQNSSNADLAKIAVVHHTLEHELRIAVPRVYPTALRGEWVLNLDRSRDANGTPAWTTTDRDIAFYIHWDGNEPTAGNRDRLFTIPSSGGFVFEEDISTAAANSSAMTAEYEGAGLSLGIHRARIVDAHVEYEPHTGSFSIEPVVDGNSQGAIALNVTGGAALYGSATYGVSAYAGVGRRKAYTPLPIGAYGRSVVTKFTYTGTERLKIFTHAYGIVPDAAPLQMSE